MKIGIEITCPVCGLQKKPRGRSAPIEMAMCEPDTCPQYRAEPKVGDLWPGESEADFGHPATNDGTRILAAPTSSTEPPTPVVSTPQENP